ncbi:hypothetical protein Tco_0783545 [Tanacetum coccineum]
MMKLEYIYEGDGDIFVDYSWERALSIDNEIYPEWVLEFFSTLYFDKDVDRNNLMKEKFALGLFIEDEVEYRLFEVYFGKLEVDDKHFDHKDYWTRVGKPTLTNHKEVLVKEPLMRIVHKVIVRSLVHRVASREICQKQDLWMMHALEESRRVNLAWIIADHLYKHAPGTKENIVICTSKMLADVLDLENTCLKKETEIPTLAEEGSREPRQDHRGLNSNFRVSTLGNEVGGSSRGAGFNDDDDDMDESIWNSEICTFGHKHVVWIGPRDKKLIGRRKMRKNEDHTLRRALCRSVGGIAAWQKARLDCRLGQVFAARQDHDDEFEGRSTTLGVTLIAAIGGPWRATSPNL